MPPAAAAGPNYKRKDANKKKKKKKKKKNNTTTKKSISSSIQSHSAGEQSDGGLNAEKINEDNTLEKTHTAATQKHGRIDRGSTSQEPHEKILNSRKQTTTVADYLCQPIESSSPEKGDHKVEDLAIKTPSSIIDQEVASRLNKSTNIYLQKENVEETPLEQRVFNENVLKSNPLSKENEVLKLASDEKDSVQSENSLVPDSTSVKCPYCGKSDDRVESTPECSERQPLLLPASTPQVSEKSCWKSCCGIFELFSNSRN